MVYVMICCSSSVVDGARREAAPLFHQVSVGYSILRRESSVAHGSLAQVESRQQHL